MKRWKRFFGHLNTILTHKKWVYHYAKALGYPWTGIKHDLSKFSPVEFSEGVRFWTGTSSPILEAKQIQGISYAWLHHKGRNKHHYEYWLDYLDDGGKAMKMPFKYVIEMICDWLGAARAYNKVLDGNIFEREYKWWEEKKKKAMINSQTAWLISTILWNLKETRGTEKEVLANIKKFIPQWEKSYNFE